MNFHGIVFVVVIFAVGAPGSQGYTGCSLSGYFEMGLMERLAQSSIVVYGRTVEHKANLVKLDGTLQYVIDAIYEVHCVFRRAEDPINERISVTAIAPRDACSATKSTSMMKVGDYSILSLRNVTGGLYVYNEIMPGSSAAVTALKPYFFSLAKVCDLQNWNPPQGASTNRCPICGISDFPAEVKALDTTYISPTNCISTRNVVITNMQQCDYYMEYTMDDANSRTCVPATFTQSCARLLTRPPTAVCDCNIKSDSKDFGVGKGLITIPSLLITLIAAVVALMV